MSDSISILTAEIADLRIALASAVKEASDNAHELVLSGAELADLRRGLAEAKGVGGIAVNELAAATKERDEARKERNQIQMEADTYHTERDNAQHSVEALTCRAEQAEERARIAEHQPQTDSGTVAEMGRQLRATLDRAIAAENESAKMLAVVEAARASSDNSIMAGSTRLKCALADLDGGDHARKSNGGRK